MISQWFDILQSMPLWLSTLTWLLLSTAAAVTVNLVFEKLLKYMVRTTHTELDDEIINSLQKPIFVTIVLIGLIFSSSSSSVSLNTTTLYRQVLVTICILIWSYAGKEISGIIFENLQRRHEFEHGERLADIAPFLKSLMSLLIITGAMLFILSYWNINIGPALASAGVVGVAFAFAAKDTVANLFGGISVFFDKPYKIGDYVIVKDLYRGEVIEIGMRSTRIKTRDDVLLTVPNSVMVTDYVINETGFDSRLRIRIPFGISYNTDLDKAETLIIDTIKKNRSILKSPPPKVRYRKFGESAIELEALAVLKDPQNRGRIIHEIIKKLHRTLDEEGVDIPYPQREVHLKNNDT